MLFFCFLDGMIHTFFFFCFHLIRYDSSPIYMHIRLDCIVAFKIVVLRCYAF